MGSPLGSTLANVFLVYFEKDWLQNFPFDLKSHYYQRYVDDIFVLFTSLEHLEAFRNFLNGRHDNMSFTMEYGKQNRISFVDVQVICENKTFTTSVYRISTFSGVYTHFDSFLPSTYKFGTVYKLAYRCSRKWSRWTKLRSKLVSLKQFFLKMATLKIFCK